MENLKHQIIVQPGSGVAKFQISHYDCKPHALLLSLRFSSV